MKTVLFVGTGSGNGGSAACLATLLRYLDRSRYRPIVAHANPGSLYLRQIRSQGIPVFPIHPSFRMAWRLSRLIVREKVDLVHANNDLYSHAGTIVAARATGRPCVVHMRSIRPLTRMEKFLVRFVDHFLIISGIGRRYYLGQGMPRQRISVWHDGIDLRSYEENGSVEAVRRRLGAQDGELMIGMISRLMPAKGQEDFLQAISRLSQKCPKLKALIVGGDPDPEGRYAQRLREMIERLGLKGRVRMLGWQKDIAQINAALDIAVQASHLQEGFGTAIMEAMAAAKPVVATRVGGIPELVEEGRTALLVPPNDPASLAQALERLVSDEKMRATFGREGRRRLERFFEQGWLIKQLEALYRWLLEKGK